VKSNLFAPSPFQDDLQSLSDSGRISGRILIDWGREHPSGGCGFPIGLEDAEDRRWEDNASVGSLGLGWGDYQLSLDPMDLTLNSEFSGAEVQIIPLKGADLTSAQAGGEFQQEEFVATILLGFPRILCGLLGVSLPQYFHIPPQMAHSSVLRLVMGVVPDGRRATNRLTGAYTAVSSASRDLATVSSSLRS